MADQRPWWWQEWFSRQPWWVQQRIANQAETEPAEPPSADPPTHES